MQRISQVGLESEGHVRCRCTEQATLPLERVSICVLLLCRGSSDYSC